MSFSIASKIANGDLVIFYLTPSIMSSVIVNSGELQSVYGCFKHVDIVGKPFGSIVRIFFYFVVVEEF